MNGVPIHDRRTGEVRDERVYKDAAMSFLFGTGFGFLLSELIARSRSIQNLYAWQQEKGAVDRKILEFVQHHEINLDEVEHPLETYRTFDDFFTRRLKPGARPIAKAADALISPADAKITAFPIREETAVPVKGKRIALAELLGSPADAAAFRDGVCIVCRLAPSDYHRFCYVDDGAHERIRRLPGLYRAVSPLSLRHMKDVFAQNRRDVTLLRSRRFGLIAHVDVGALAVGRIYQHHAGGTAVRLGQEKGYFGFGGSTIVLLFQRHRARIDDDIWTYSRQGIETQVLQGERIGRAVTPFG